MTEDKTAVDLSPLVNYIEGCKEEAKRWNRIADRQQAEADYSRNIAKTWEQKAKKKGDE